MGSRCRASVRVSPFQCGDIFLQDGLRMPNGPPSRELETEVLGQYACDRAT